MKVFWCFVLMMCAVPCFAQKEAENWYFGYGAGLTFESGIPEPIYDGKLISDEGCASMSDKNGKLLFYTDGQNVWNANHSTMPNGRGLIGGKKGTTSGSSSAQCVLIVPDPANSSRYYIFVTPDISTSPNNKTDNLTTYIVDMNRNNGLGDVLTARITLNPSSEKLTGTIDCHGTGFWIVAHHNEKNEFYSYHLTKQGLSRIPVISTIGNTLSGNFPGASDYSVSCMKISPDGKLLAFPVRGNINVELFNFDNRTGNVSNPRTILSNINVYGTSFSPDSRKLYINGASSPLLQFSVSETATADEISASKKIITPSLGIGSMQIGPDKRIYTVEVGKRSVSSIINPNSDDPVFVSKAVEFKDDLPNRSSFGLPNFIDNIFHEGSSPVSCMVSGITSDTTCEGGSASFNDTSAANINVFWQWEFPGGVPSTSTVQNPKNILYDKAGEYPVKLIRFSSYFGSDTVFSTVLVHPRPLADAGSDITLCPGSSAQMGTPAITGNAYSWTPTDGLDNPNIAQPRVTPVSDGKKYFLKVTNEFGCEATDSVVVSIGEIQAIVRDTSVCRGSSVVLKATGGSEYEWSPSYGLSATTGASIMASPLETTVYRLIARSGECRDTAFLKVTVLDLPSADAGSDKEICFGESVELGAVSDEPGLRFEWNPQEGLSDPAVSNPIAAVLKTTEYILTVMNEAGCVGRDTVLIKVDNLLKVTLSNDTAICAGGSVQLSAVSDENVSYKWSPETGLDNPSIANPTATPTETTTYTVLAFKNGGLCSAVDSVRIEVLKLPEVITKDITLCEGESGELWAESDEPVVSWSWTPTTGLSNPNIQNPIVTAFKSEVYTVAATNENGCTVVKTLSVTVTEKENITAVLKAEKAELEPGESTTVKLLLKAENSAGITSFKAQVHFDANVFQFTKNSGKFLNGTDNTWRVDANQQNGILTIEANGQTPIAMSELAFELTAYLAKQTNDALVLKLTELNGEVLKESTCQQITEIPTTVVLKEVCAGDMRLVNVGEFQTALQQITPNPVTNETIEINYSVGIEGVISLEMYNSQGELLKTIFKGNQKTGVFKEMISTEEIPAGVFLVKLSTLQVTQTQMFTLVK